MIKVEIVCNSELQMERAKEIKDKSGDNATFVLYDENKKKDSYKAKSLRHKWASKKCPFILVSDDENELCGFWTEAGDVFSDFEEWLNDYANVKMNNANLKK